MVLFDFLFVIVITLLVTALFALVLRRTAPWGSFFWFLSLLVLLVWAGGLWLQPVGPALWGVHWASFVLVGLVVVLLLAAVTPARSPRVSREIGAGEQTEESTAVAIGALFWLLIAGLVALILVHYLIR